MSDYIYKFVLEQKHRESFTMCLERLSNIASSALMVMNKENKKIMIYSKSSDILAKFDLSEALTTEDITANISISINLPEMLKKLNSFHELSPNSDLEFYSR